MKSELQTIFYNQTTDLSMLELYVGKHNQFLKGCDLCPLADIACISGLVSLTNWTDPTMFYSNSLSWILIVLARWNNRRQVCISPLSDLLFWILTNQPSLYYIYCVIGVETVASYFKVFGLTRPRIKPTTSHTRISLATQRPSFQSFRNVYVPIVRKV